MPADKKEKRILFLTWGYSIHSKRRIEIFSEDPSFTVAVVSSYDYQLKNTENYLLSDATKSLHHDKIDQSEGHGKQNWLYALVARYKYLISNHFNIVLLIIGLKQLITSNFLSSDDISKKKGDILRHFLSSQRLRSDLIKVAKDLKILKAAILSFKPDIIFLQTLLHPSYLVFFLPFKIPILITFWNGDLQWIAQWDKIDYLVKRQIVAYGVNIAKKITVNSKNAFDICLRYGAKSEDVHLIRYPGVDTDRFKPISKSSAKKKLSIGRKRMVLWPRGLGQYLNSEVIVKCAPYVLKQYPDTLFCVLISNDNYPDLEKHQALANEMGVGLYFRWINRVSWDEMPLYYSAADVTISIASKDSFPNCMIESMACKSPVIMGDIKPIREWVRDGVNGFLVAPEDHKALAKRIKEVFNYPKDMLMLIIENAYDKVTNEADYKSNKKLIKELASRVAALKS